MRLKELLKLNSLLKAVVLILVINAPVYANAQTFDWVKQVAGTGSNLLGMSVTSDAAGNVYVTGNFKGTADFDPGAGTALLTAVGNSADAFLAKYDAHGNYIWVKAIMAGAGSDGGESVVVSADGKVNVVGGFSGKAYFNTNTGIDSFTTLLVFGEMFLAQYDTAGNYIWAKHVKSVGSGAKAGSGGNAMDIDRQGNIYITGTFQATVDFDPGPGTALRTAVSNSTRNQTNLFVAKYDSKGNYIWAGGIGGTDYAQGFGIAIDTTGGDNVYVTGFFVGTMDFNTDTAATAVANLVSQGGNDVFIAKYDSGGHYIWAKGIGGSINDNGIGVVVNKSGNAYVTGTTLSSAIDFDPGPDTAIRRMTGLTEMFLAKYDANGNYVWAINIGGLNTTMTQGQSLALDKWESIYVAGYVGNGTVDFDPGPGEAKITSTSTSEAFLAKYDACGNYISVGGLLGTESTGSITLSPHEGCITANSEGNVYYVGGLSRGKRDFNPGVDTAILTPVGDQDIFLTKQTFSDTPSIIAHLTVSACKNYMLNGINYTGSGIYTQVVPGTQSCDSIIILNLTIDQIVKPVITISGFELSVTGSYATYQWLKDGVSIPGATANTFFVTQNGSYRVAVTNAMGCEDTSDIYTVTNTRINAGFISKDRINIYPNPAQDIVYVQAPVPITAILTDMQGRPIIEMEHANTISLKNLASGIYLLRIVDNNGVLIKTEKLVKAR